MNPELPRLLSVLSERAKVPVSVLGEERGFALYQADLTDIRLRWSDQTPFIGVRAQDAKEDLPKTWSGLMELIAQHEWQDSIPLILVEGESASFRERAIVARESQFLVAILDDKVAEEMATSRSAITTMIDAILPQIPRRRLLPYVLEAPVTGSGFWDRDSEVNHIVTTRSNWAVTGMRRIGKTSVLHEAERLLKRKNQATAFIICTTLHSYDEFVQAVVRQLRDTELRHLQHHFFHLSNFLERMPKYKNSPLTIFMDEVDPLFRIDRQSGYPILNALRDAHISTRSMCRFVFAGSSVLEAELADTKSPLYSWAQRIALSTLLRNQVQSLICQPFENVRIKITNTQELVNRIFHETGGHPNMVQYYCTHLADVADRQSRTTISDGDLSSVYADRGFRDFVMRVVETSTGPMERLIVFLMTDQSGFSQKHIDAALKSIRITATFGEINTACGNLESAAIFRKIGPHYYFNQPLLTLVLKQNYELDYLIMKAREELGR